MGRKLNVFIPKKIQKKYDIVNKDKNNEV